MVLKAQEAPDGFGGFVRTWQESHPLWANIKFTARHKILQSSHERAKQGAHAAEDLLFEITVRAPASLKAGERLKWHHRHLCIITDPVPNLRKGYVTIFACQLLVEGKVVLREG